MIELRRKTPITWVRGYIGLCKRMWSSELCGFIKMVSFLWMDLIKPVQLVVQWKASGWVLVEPGDLIGTVG